MVLIKSS